jgi:exodeoxyribonuclease V alpha subunit
MPTELTGQITHITYTNDENGYTIAKVKVRGRKNPVTVVGALLAPTVGEVLDMQGEWVSHPKYGRQFKVSSSHSKVPVTVEGIEKYLGSGLVKGLGPVMAGRIVKKFGLRALDVIDKDTKKLATVDGIGPQRISLIKEAWKDQKEIRGVMLFLHSHGVSSSYGVKIFKKYGQRSIAVVKKNPYRLADDIFGIGFATADKIAANLGFAKDAPARISAGILYVLEQLAGDGHVYYPYAELVEKCEAILEVGTGAVADGLGSLIGAGTLVAEDLNDSIDDFQANYKAVYLRKYHHYETGVAKRVRRLAAAPKAVQVAEPKEAINWAQHQLAIRLAPAQLTALKKALKDKILVITGGPGTGKTTIINGILRIFKRMKVSVMLAAPTGRAAKRMSEACHHPAKTIHRMLEFNLVKGGFQKNEKKPLKCDLLVVDEASMIDTALMYHLMQAVPDSVTLILVGDVNQLPSVGAGNVLKDIIAAKTIAVVTLTEIFRQAQQSRIIVNAHKIHNGVIPSFKPPLNDHLRDDFYFINQEDPQRVLEIILKLVQKRIPARFGFDPVDEIQVLTPMHKGVVGTANLNQQLQEALNPGIGGVVRGDRLFRIKDKVMQIKNNYDKNVFNGDIGRIKQIDTENQEVFVLFDNRQVSYDFSELDELVLAYAVSVHKSQGSEYPAVVIPILTQHFLLLQRNLIYTAVTRGRALVVIVGTPKALAIGVKNDKPHKRFTRLSHRLR